MQFREVQQWVKSNNAHELDRYLIHLRNDEFVLLETPIIRFEDFGLTVGGGYVGTSGQGLHVVDGLPYVPKGRPIRLVWKNDSIGSIKDPIIIKGRYSLFDYLKLVAVPDLTHQKLWSTEVSVCVAGDPDRRWYKKLSDIPE